MRRDALFHIAVLLCFLTAVTPVHVWASGKPTAKVQDLQARSNEPGFSRPALQATVRKARYLPPDMYGQWNLAATLVDANDPTYFAPVMSELWILEQDGDRVILRNATNGASAEVNVTEVHGNTATFQHTVASDRMPFILHEIPTVTVEGDRLVGISMNHVQQVDKKGQIRNQWWGKYQLEAHRLAGSRVTFGIPQQAEPDEFEVEPVQSEAEYLKSVMPSLGR